MRWAWCSTNCSPARSRSTPERAASLLEMQESQPLAEHDFHRRGYRPGGRKGHPPLPRSRPRQAAGQCALGRGLALPGGDPLAAALGRRRNAVSGTGGRGRPTGRNGAPILGALPDRDRRLPVRARWRCSARYAAAMHTPLDSPPEVLAQPGARNGIVASAIPPSRRIPRCGSTIAATCLTI